MTCIKTGADVLLDSHGATVHGDLYEVGDTYILLCGASVHDCMEHDPSRYHIRVKGDWHALGSRAIAFEASAAIDFNYEGTEL